MAETKIQELSKTNIKHSGAVLNRCPENQDVVRGFNIIVKLVRNINGIPYADRFKVFKMVMSNSSMRNEWITNKWDVEYIEQNIGLVQKFFERNEAIRSLPLVQNWITNRKMFQFIWLHKRFVGNTFCEEDIFKRIRLFRRNCTRNPQLKKGKFKEYQIKKLPPKLRSYGFPDRPDPRFVSSFLDKKIWKKFLTDLDVKIVSSTSFFKVLSGTCNKIRDIWVLEKINGIIYVKHIPYWKTMDVHSIGHLVEKGACVRTNNNQSIFNACVNNICGINCFTTSEIDCFDDRGRPIEIKSSIVDEKPRLKDIVQISINRSKSIHKFLREGERVVGKKIYNSQKLRDRCANWSSTGQRVKYMLDLIQATDFSKGIYTLRLDANYFPVIKQSHNFL